jgi:hypothetical protein
MNDSTKCSVVKILPGKNPNGPLPQPTRGTRVMLSNGAELEGITGIQVEAQPQGVWTAKIELTVYLNEMGEMGALNRG